MIDAMLGLHAPLSVTLADMDVGNIIYLAFFIVAGLASALGKLLKRGKDKKNTDDAVPEPELEAEILPEAAPARKVMQPQPSVMTSRPQPLAARPVPTPSMSLPPPVPSIMKSVPTPPPIKPPPIKPPPTTPRKPRRVTQEAQAKAAYEEQAEPVRPPSPRATRQPVTLKRAIVPPDVRVLRRLLADRTGQRAAVALCEVLGSPIALRESHLER